MMAMPMVQVEIEEQATACWCSIAEQVACAGTGSADVGAADIGSLPAGPSASGPHMQWLKVSHPNCSGSQSWPVGSCRSAASASELERAGARWVLLYLAGQTAIALRPPARTHMRACKLWASTSTTANTTTSLLVDVRLDQT